jgi:CRISPR-associated protein Cas1
MNDNYHVFSNGRIERKDNTIRLITEDGEKKHIPVENAEAIFLHGQIDFNTKFVSFLNDQGVSAHVFGWYDNYAGSIMPKRGQTSGQTLVKQVRAYDDSDHRLSLAKSFVEGSIHNMRSNVTYYDGRGQELANVLTAMEEAAIRLEEVTSVSEAMGVEASARRSYYSTFEEVTAGELTFGIREYDPPPNEMNALISYGNSLVYASVVSAIRATALDPAVSFLHEPGERRYSLALDIADLFKPLLTDRIIFRLVNRGQLTEADFEAELDACLLTEDGRETYTKAFEETLERTIQHPDLGKKVSYQYLLRVEAYKLKKHLLAGEEYKPFKRWW